MVSISNQSNGLTRPAQTAERSAAALQQMNAQVQGLKEKRPLKELEAHDVYFSTQSSRAKVDRFFDAEDQRTLVFQFEPTAQILMQQMTAPPIAMVLEKFPQPALRVGLAWQQVDPVYRLQKILYSPIQHQALMMETFGFDQTTPVKFRPFQLKPIIRVEATNEYIPLPEITQPAPVESSPAKVSVSPAGDTFESALKATAVEPAAEAAAPVQEPQLEAIPAGAGAVYPQPALGVSEKYHPWRDRFISILRRFLPGGKLGPLQVFENGEIHFFKWQLNPVRYLVDDAGRRVKLFHMAQLNTKTLVDVQDAVTLPIVAEEGIPLRKTIKEKLLNEMSRIEEQGYQLQRMPDAMKALAAEPTAAPDLSVLPGGPLPGAPFYGHNPFKLSENQPTFQPSGKLED